MPRMVVTGSELPLVAGRVDGLRGAADPVARPAVAPRPVEGIADAPHDEADRGEDDVEEDGQDDAAVHLAEERPGTHPHALDRGEYTNDRAEPPLLAHAHEGPQLSGQRNDARTCHRSLLSQRLPAPRRSCQALENPSLSNRAQIAIVDSPATPPKRDPRPVGGGA